MSGFTVTQTQRQQLIEQGYVLLPGGLPDGLLARWRDLATTLEEQAVRAHTRGEPLHGVCVVEDPVGPRLARYDDLLEVDREAVLDLLACPAMLAVARELCGRGSVPLQVDLLYKHQHPHPVILWHQGAPHPRGFPYLNVGIHLDDAGPGDGCLRYVPRTQHELQDIGSLAGEYGWEIPGVVEQPTAAGDILVQDMMILHGSPPKRTAGVRRTVYVELRPAEGIRESGAQSEPWAELRQRWMALVLRRAALGAWPGTWRTDLPGDLGDDADEVALIAANAEPPIPSVYSPLPVETEDYPVPAALRGHEAEGRHQSQPS